MPVFRLDDRLVFPPVHLAEDGLLALGGDLRPERLLLAYTQGIFPWYAENLPILWHSPDPRMIMTTRDLVVQKSLRKVIRRRPYTLKMDTAFVDVLIGCSSVRAPGRPARG
jgi:leucyl/phenylalanyl-tRNA--protein transferase